MPSLTELGDRAYTVFLNLMLAAELVQHPPLSLLPWEPEPALEGDRALEPTGHRLPSLDVEGDCLAPERATSRVMLPLITRLPHRDYAAPIMPLQDRDLAVLQDWFDQTSMDAIDQDVRERLALLVPEPCWEDNPYDFLEEFL